MYDAFSRASTTIATIAGLFFERLGMTEWQRTTSTRRGTYRRFGVNELYVRFNNPAGWSWFLDGMPGGTATSEAAAQAEAEITVRGMASTHTGRLAATAA
jgi:hypothetical protein